MKNDIILGMFWQRRLPTVTFATAVWEKDWKQILLDPDYLCVSQIENHQFPFIERLLIINNVSDLEEVKEAAQMRVEEGILTRYAIADEKYLSLFGLKRNDFTEWQFYNALAPLSAIAEAKGDYLLYLTGDVRLDKPVKWIPQALCRMEKNPVYKVANLTWNERYDEAKRESYRSDWSFYIAKQGFSDQMFLVKSGDFRAPIYGEVRFDSAHYPRGDVFEKRVFSYMKNHGWERITFRRGSYTHENF
jgi:hypothetical protein